MKNPKSLGFTFVNKVSMANGKSVARMQPYLRWIRRKIPLVSLTVLAFWENSRQIYKLGLPEGVR